MGERPLVIVRAVRRPDTNVYFTLACMAAADPVGFAGSDVVVMSADGDIGFLECLANTRHVKVYVPPGIEKIATWRPKRRICWSMMQAILYAQSENRSCFLIEDDVSFANEWICRMQQRIEHLTLTCGEQPFLLSAYYRSVIEDVEGAGVYPHHSLFRMVNRVVHQPRRASGRHHDRTVKERSRVPFYSTLCVYWCRKAMEGFADFAQGVLDEDETRGPIHISGDGTVDGFCVAGNVPIFYSVPSLVQHHGDITSAVDFGIRRSPIFATFREAEPCRGAGEHETTPRAVMGQDDRGDT